MPGHLTIRPSKFEKLADAGVSLLAGLKDLVPNAGTHLSFPVPESINIARCHTVMNYVQFGGTSRDLEEGLCTPEIMFLGAERFFQKTVDWDSLEQGGDHMVLKPYSDRFSTHMHDVMPIDWSQFTCEKYALQNYYVDRFLAADQTLERFDQGTLLEMPPTQFSKHSRHGRYAIIKSASEADHDVKMLKFKNLEAKTSELRTTGPLKTAPWHESGRQSDGIIMAGGSLESMLQGNTPHDYDLFVIVGGDAANDTDVERRGRRVVTATVASILDFADANGYTAYVSTKAHVVDVTLQPKGKPEKRVKFQVITKVYASPAQVVAGFDIDSCRLVFDGLELLAHWTALRAWRNGWNVFDATTLSTTAIHRYTKKWLAGMGILFLGVSQNEVDLMLQTCEAMVDVVNYIEYDVAAGPHLSPADPRMVLAEAALQGLSDFGVKLILKGSVSAPFRMSNWKIASIDGMLRVVETTIAGLLLSVTLQKRLNIAWVTEIMSDRKQHAADFESDYDEVFEMFEDEQADPAMYLRTGLEMTALDPEYKGLRTNYEDCIVHKLQSLFVNVDVSHGRRSFGQAIMFTGAFNPVSADIYKRPGSMDAFMMQYVLKR